MLLITAQRTERKRINQKRRRLRSQWLRRNPSPDQVSLKRHLLPSCRPSLLFWMSTSTRSWSDITTVPELTMPMLHFCVIAEFQDSFEALLATQSFPSQNYLARNFYNLRFLALFVCFAINFILLFYKVKTIFIGRSSHSSHYFVIAEHHSRR